MINLQLSTGEEIGTHHALECLRLLSSELPWSVKAGLLEGLMRDDRWQTTLSRLTTELDTLAARQKTMEDLRL